MDKSAKPRLIDIPKFADPRGNLSFIQFPDVCPFEIERVYWLYDVPTDSVRDGRALQSADELIIAVSGAFDVITDDGLGDTRVFHLDKCYKALLIPAGNRKSIKNFVTNSIALVLSSAPVTEKKDKILIDIDNDLEAADLKKNKSYLHSSLGDVKIIEFKKDSNFPGTVSSVDNFDLLKSPFKVKRAFYLYDIPTDSERGGHCHYEMQELIIALSGAFEVEVDDGYKKQRWRLEKPYLGLLVPAGLWRIIDNFSGGTLCLALASTKFSEDDYVRDYEEFLRLTEHKRK